MNFALVTILGSATAVFLFPLLMPWGKTLLRASFVVWFVLWGLFFYFAHEESKSLASESTGYPLLFGLLILLYSVSFVLRLLARHAVQWAKRARMNEASKPKPEGIE
jgi:hypothetical protein